MPSEATTLVLDQMEDSSLMMKIQMAKGQIMHQVLGKHRIVTSIVQPQKQMMD